MRTWSPSARPVYVGSPFALSKVGNDARQIVVHEYIRRLITFGQDPYQASGDRTHLKVSVQNAILVQEFHSSCDVQHEPEDVAILQNMTTIESTVAFR